jgi:hypothetical protein
MVAASRAVSGTVWAGWLAWSRWVSLREPLPWVLLGAGYLLAVSTYPLVHAHRERAQKHQARWEAERERRRAKHKWPALLERTGHAGIRVLAR